VEAPLPGFRESLLASRLRDLNLRAFNSTAKISRQSDKITVELNESILFESSRAGLTGSGLAIVRQLAPALTDPKIRISVEGHTDSRPIFSCVYPSNWELSGARAAAVARALIAGGIMPSRIRIIGRADTMPAADNDTPVGRQKNRRVAIVISFEEII